MRTKKLSYSLLCAVFCLTVVLQPITAFAQTEEEEPFQLNDSDRRTEWGVDFYDTSGGVPCDPSDPNIGRAINNPADEEAEDQAVNNNTDYAGNQIWTDEELELIAAHTPVYQQAAQEHDVPWWMLAVVHKRETNLRLNYPANGQGLFQFYHMAGQFPTSGTASPEQFLEETMMLADQLQNDYVNRNHSANKGPLRYNGTPDNVVQDTFFSYNGRAGVYKAQAERLGYVGEDLAFNGSPYVMNKADAQRDPNENPTGWGQIKSDGGAIQYPANQDYGAWVYYAAIAGIDSNCAFDHGPTRTIMMDGHLYAWPVGPGQRKEDHYTWGHIPCSRGGPEYGGCHHDHTAAFDIVSVPQGQAAVGTPVYAIIDGEIVGREGRGGYIGQNGCHSIQLLGADGYQYWYGHIMQALDIGEEVRAGQQIGVIGEQRCAGRHENPVHMHIDRGNPRGTPGGGRCVRNASGGCDIDITSRNAGLTPIMNALWEALD